MKTFWKALGVVLVSLALWGCGGQPQSQNETQTAAQEQEVQGAEVAATTQAPVGTRPFITKWKGEAGKSIEIPALGTYTLTWYNEATPNERHTEQGTVTTEMIEPYGEEDFLENVISLILLIRPLMVFMLL